MTLVRREGRPLFHAPEKGRDKAAKTSTSGLQKVVTMKTASGLEIVRVIRPRTFGKKDNTETRIAPGEKRMQEQINMSITLIGDSGGRKRGQL